MLLYAAISRIRNGANTCDAILKAIKFLPPCTSGTGGNVSQLIAALLGVEADLILQHHKRRAIQKLTVTLVVSIITASLLLLHWLGVKGL